MSNKILTDKLIKKLEDKDFHINIYDGSYVEFEKWTPTRGHDCIFTINLGKNKDEFYENLEYYYMNFDPSEETRTYATCDLAGVPDDIGDILDDMKECEEIIREACAIISFDFYGFNKQPKARTVHTDRCKQESLETAIAYWVETQFGRSEVSEPSWDIPTLASFLEQYLEDSLSDEERKDLESYEKPNWGAEYEN